MSKFLPFEQMERRLEVEKRDSDTALFFCLLYHGELLVKTVVLGLCATLGDDPDRCRYGLYHRLARADGIGEWVQVLDQILGGPPSQLLDPEAYREQRELTQRVDKDSWQYGSVVNLCECAKLLGAEAPEVGAKTTGKVWFSVFAAIRNRSRGHGAPGGAKCSAVCSHLEAGIRQMVDGFSLFTREWAHLHQNLSGKYRVTDFSDGQIEFTNLRISPEHKLLDGVYIHINGPKMVHLIDFEADSLGVFIANGNYHEGRYEKLNYVNDVTKESVDEDFRSSPGRLPESHTSGRGELVVMGNCFTNLPEGQPHYVQRQELEKELCDQLLLDRHEIVALTGAGGIGKTSLALRVLHDLAQNSSRFDVIIWFSARDIDLLERGPKPVRPDSLTEADFAKSFVSLIRPEGSSDKDFKPTEYLASCLQEGAAGTTLFVFDNFETVDDPLGFFSTIDNNVRSPNKVLITTRMRDFKGDYPMRVAGMGESEGRELIDITAARLGVRNLITESYIKQLFDESDGHPYVMKVLLGEVAKAKALVKPERIVAEQDAILAALFERSYVTLSTAAQRVFLLLSSWRSVVPELAVEVVMLRSENERMHVTQALDELKQFSLVEEVMGGDGNEVFISVPLASMLFGRRKLKASPLRAAVDADRDMLMWFGPSTKTDARGGYGSAIKRLIERIAERVASGDETLASHRETLEFVARRVPAAWLLIADLYVEQADAESLEHAKDCMRRFLEAPDGSLPATAVWRRLASLCHRTEDTLGEVHALVEICETADASTKALSDAANRINGIYRSQRQGQANVFESTERKLLVNRVITALDAREQGLDADDCSRLAWLHLSVGNEARASYLAELGCKKDPYNDHCRKLEARLAGW
jgi:hypothetical protein